MVIRQSQEIVVSWNLVWPVDTETACVVEKAWPGFPHSSVGKECTCNAGDLSSILGLGISAGEGIGYPFQYSWASLGSAGCKDSINCK